MARPDPTAARSTSLEALAARHGGVCSVQHGRDAPRPLKPPRRYWLIVDQPPGAEPNAIRSAARIDKSWGMALRLQSDPGYRRRLDSMSMTYLLRGRGTFFDPSGKRPVRAGHLLLLFPGIPHAYCPKPGGRWDEINLFFQGPVFEAWRGAGLLDPAQPVQRLEPIAYWLDRIQDAVLPLAGGGRRQTPQDWGRLTALIGDMIAAWRQVPRAPESDWLARACRALDAIPPGADPDWPALARTLGVSPRTLRRKFTRLHGETPCAFLGRRRIEQAQRRLLESDDKMADIAQALRFENEFHFSRRFKRFTGLSPRAYRDLHRNR